MKNRNWCVYTYKHRRAFEYILNKLVKDDKLKEEMLRRAKVHDLDKVVMYMFLDQYESQRQHVKTKSHHLEYDGEHSYYDLVETVIDYECSPYTKPDKPLNAYDFANKLFGMGLIQKDIFEKLMQIMHDFGIDNSSNVLDDKDGIEFVDSIGDVTDEMILLEVMQYINENDCPELEYIKNRVYNL